MAARIGPRNQSKWRVYFKEWREKKELTQEQLAERIGTTHVTVSRMETGSRQWNSGYLAALAHALGIEPQDLFHHPDKPTIDELLRHASPDERVRAVEVVKALSKLAS